MSVMIPAMMAGSSGVPDAPPVPPPETRLFDEWLDVPVPWGADHEALEGHLHRYGVAFELAGDATVLVLGGGEGYGAAILASAARRVLAVEAESDLVLHARYNYRRDNLQFVHGVPAIAAGDLDAGFQLIVALEPSAGRFDWNTIAKEAARILDEDGVLVAAAHLRLADCETGQVLLTDAPSLGPVAAQIEEHFGQVLYYRQRSGSFFERLAGGSAVDDAPARLGRQSERSAGDGTVLIVASREPAGIRTLAARLDREPGFGSRLAPGDAVEVEVEVGSPDPAATADDLGMRRQLLAFEVGIVRAVADARAARREAESVRAELELSQIERFRGLQSVDDARDALAASDSEVERLEAERDVLGTDAARLEVELATGRSDAARLEADVASLRDALRHAQTRLATIEGSRAYRALRSAVRAARSFSGRRPAADGR